MSNFESVAVVADASEHASLLERELANIPPEIARRIGQKARFAASFESRQLVGLSEELKADLKRVDDASEAAAAQSGELVFYHRGELTDDLDAASLCFWTSRRAAAEALHSPDHLEGIDLTRSGTVYDTWTLQFHDVHPDAEHGFALTPFADPHTTKINQQGE